MAADAGGRELSHTGVAQRFNLTFMAKGIA